MKSLATVSAALALTLVAGPARAWSDAGVEASPFRDAAVDQEPEHAPVTSTPHVPDGRLQSFTACAPTGGTIGLLESPTRLRFALEAPWAGSLSEIELFADVTGHEEIPVELVSARVVGEPWVQFENMTFTDEPADAGCPESMACDPYAVTLHGRLPALSRVPQPFELELGQTLGAHAVFAELCLRVTAYESSTPGPLIGPSPDASPDASPDQSEADAFYDFWEDAPDAGGADFPVGDDEAPAEAGNTGGGKRAGAADGAGEKAACSATPGADARAPSGLPAFLLLAALGAGRRRARLERR